MMNGILTALLIFSVVTAAFTGRMEALSAAALSGCGEAVSLVIALTGMLCLWNGLMEIARRCRLTEALARLLRPLTRWLFPTVPQGSPAMQAICMNLSANLLGLGNAATPLGLAAMRELQKLNPHKTTASNAMVTFVAMNTASLQLIADGRNTNTAAIALSYGQQIASAYGADLLSQNGGSSPVKIESRAWFNPNLITRWFIVPGLIAVLVLINSILSGALSIAREREEGTFDQLLVAPYTPGEILLGKGTASVITGIIQAVFVVLVAMFWFRIPFQGSIWLLSAALLLFIVTAAAIGLCISSFAQSLQQAIVGTFLLLVPMVMLSGFATPISSMPEIFQSLTLLNPMRYGLELIQRIFLEGAGFLDLWPLFAAIMAVTVVAVLAAVFSFLH